MDNHGASPSGCASCEGSGWPGHVSVPVPMAGRTVPAWSRCPARCTEWSRRKALAQQQQEKAASTAVSTPEPQPAAPGRRPASPRPAPAYRAKQSTTVPRAGTRQSSAPAARGPQRWPALCLDLDDGQWSTDIPDIPVPAGPKLNDFFAWLGAGLPLKVERVHPAGSDADGIVCLGSAAARQLGLPAVPPAEGPATSRLHAKIAKAAGAVGMEISDVLGPTMHAFRRKGAPGGPKASVRLVITPWLGHGTDKQLAVTAMLTTLAAQPDGSGDALTLARRIRTFVADLGVAPGVTPATTSMTLLEAVRPRMQWVEGKPGERTLREDALPAGDLCVPPAAGARHPLTRTLQSEGSAICEEDGYKWWARPLSPDEASKPWAVAVDVCASYLSITKTLALPVGQLEHTPEPRFDRKSAGLWWCDFTDTPVDEQLPHPATFHGMPPQGPAWYTTPTVEYMASAYGFDTSTIGEAYVSTRTSTLLKEWTDRIRMSYKRVYAILGLEESQDLDAFLAAYEAHQRLDRDDTERWDALVLGTMYKQVYKSGIGKWSDSAAHLEDDDWLETVAKSWSYRPEIRFTIVAAARIAEHRRMRKTLQKSGVAPFAVNVDSKLYPLDEPSPHAALVFGENGKPDPGTVRMGIAPGSHKHESSIPMAAVMALMDERRHPSRLTHDYSTTGARLDDSKDEEPAA